jgi:hypothetical protein
MGCCGSCLAKQPVRTEERQTLVALTGARSERASGEPISAFANTQDLLREGSIVNKVIAAATRVAPARVFHAYR